MLDQLKAKVGHRGKINGRHYRNEKKSVIKKVLMGGKPQHEIAREAGIGLSTLNYWLKHYRKN